MWKYLKELLPGKSKSSPKGVLVEGQIITDPKCKATAFKKYFSSIGQELASWLPLAASFTPPYPPNIPAFIFPTITPDFIENQLRNTPENKYVGLDRLPGRFLRAAAPVISQPLAFILSLSLKSDKFITEWKHAKVLLLYKSGPSMETIGQSQFYPSCLNYLNVLFIVSLQIIWKTTNFS